MLGHLHCCLFLSALTLILGVVLLLLLWPGFLRLQVDRLFSCCWLQLRSSLLCGESKTTGALHWAHCIPATTQHILSIYLSTQRFERECLLLTLISSQRTSPWITATARPTGWHAGARMTKGESQLRCTLGAVQHTVMCRELLSLFATGTQAPMTWGVLWLITCREPQPSSNFMNGTQACMMSKHLMR